MTEYKEELTFSLRGKGVVARKLVLRHYPDRVEAWTASDGFLLAYATKFTQAKHGIAGWVVIEERASRKHSPLLNNKAEAIRELRYRTGAM